MANESGNLLLDSLPAKERDRLLAEMEMVPMTIRDVIADPGQPMDRVYFPIDGIISVLTLLPNGEAIEAASAGWEGMAGAEVFLGAPGPENVRLVCQIDGKAWAMDAARFREESRREGPLRSMMERYVRTLLVQTTQSAGCNGAHTVEERFCKWLCLIADWLDRPEFPLTHEFAAALLGVHRPSVTIAAGTLQRAGVIDYRRGRIRILDREALGDIACPCYDVIRRAYDELKKPMILGEGPGAVRRLVALRDMTIQNIERSGREAGRSVILTREAIELGLASVRMRGERIRDR